MSKRFFRAIAPPDEPPDYPTLDEFDARRRAFLARLGGLLGASALVGFAAGCGTRRAVKENPFDPNPDPDPEIAGGAPLPPSKLDTTRRPVDGGIDATPTVPDGAAPMPDARVDPDTMPIPGEAPMPDARIDQPDYGMAGVAPAPDALVDQPDYGGPSGAAPAPDAQIDGGSCPNP